MDEAGDKHYSTAELYDEIQRNRQEIQELRRELAGLRQETGGLKRLLQDVGKRVEALHRKHG